MWKDSNRNMVVIFQPNILSIVGFYVRHLAKVAETTQKVLDLFWHDFFFKNHTIVSKGFIKMSLGFILT